MDYIEVVCPHCKKIVEFKPDESALDCPFCDCKVERIKKKGPQSTKGSHCTDELVCDAYEEGVRKGRESERERAACEARALLWFAIVSGAIGGGILGAKVEGPPERQVIRIGIGILIGGTIGGLYHIFGCLLTLLFFIGGVIALLACIIK